MKMIKKIIFAAAIALSFPAFADQNASSAPSPWFTGPLLAPTGSTYPAGHIGYQLYAFYTDNFGHYDRRWKRISTIDTHTWNPLFVAFIGLTDRSDLQLTVPYFVNDSSGVSSHGFGDASLTLGYQAMKGVLGTWKPDLKLTIAESFPIGTYENLNPGLRGTDARGTGSYQTALAATFQKVWHFSGAHYLRGRWNFTYTIPTDVHLVGLNAFGGAADTDGTINLGNHFSTDLAFEYAITRHWVPAVDFLYTASGKNIFNGNPGTTAMGLPAPISTVSSEEFSIAPALEYNFNATVGIIAGVWFTVDGRNATEFTSGVFSVVLSL